MTKLRIYDRITKKVKGTLNYSENQTETIVKFPRGSELQKKYNQVINKFLEENNLMLVSPEASYTLHSYSGHHKCRKGFKVFKIQRLFNGTLKFEELKNKNDKI